MRFARVKAHDFGLLSEEELVLAPGMTVVHGPNEAGKSTWHAALYAGFCGIRRTRGQAARKDREFRERHKPWASARWRVTATVAVERAAKPADSRRIGSVVMSPVNHWPGYPESMRPRSRLARLASASEPLQHAVGSGRFWREVPVGLDINGVLLEGALDLLYEVPDGSLSLVDYKTDYVAPREVQQRANRYALQGAAYALPVSGVTGMAVSRVEFVFPAVYPDRAEVFTVHDPDLATVLEALSAVRTQTPS